MGSSIALETHERSVRTRSFVLVASAGVLWSTIGLGVRLMEQATPFQIVFHRALAQVPVIVALLILRYRSQTWAKVRAIGWAGVAGAASLSISYVSGVYGIANTSVANALFMISVAPLVAGLLGWLVLGEKVRRSTFWAMGMALFGIVVMTSADTGGAQMIGNISAFISATTYAIFTVILRNGRRNDMMPMIALSGAFAAVIGFATSEGVVVPLRDASIAWFLGAVALAGGLSLFTAGAKGLTSAELPLVAMTEIVLGPLLVWIVVGETVAPTVVLGGAIILTAVLIQGWFGIPRLRLPRGFSI